MTNKTAIPYGKTHISCDISYDGLLTSRVEQLKSEKTGRQLVEEAMANPIGTPKLSELAVGKRTCTIIISDHTRPVPSRDILPIMLQQLRQGNPDIQVTLLVATGFHRPTTARELEAKLGPEIAGKEKIVVHDAFDPASNVRIGILPSGAPLVIDRMAVETDLLISEGFIEPHFFAGFSGGRKSVLPGVCDKTTVLGNHCGAFIASPYARTGILEGNPLHIDMLAAAKMAKLQFIVNVVINDDKQTVAAFAGDCEQAHAAGVAFLRPYCEVAAVPGDIVITSNGGAPLDQNIYQSVKGLTAAEASAKEGAVLIMCAELADGTGGEGFYRSLRDCESPEAHFAQCAATPQDQTIPDQWESQILARILMKHRIIFVSRPEMEATLREMKLDYAPDLPTALTMARAEKGENAKITIIPNGISVMVKA
ncbi:MAG: nickel-dependent lactate racemase [Oscillospiraceae bacterium]|nr:nickel-dependent lactate racemase [Oscillospiraceae bacterium]